MGFIIFLEILDLSSIPMFSLRRIVHLKQLSTPALVICYFTSAATSPYNDSFISRYLNKFLIDEHSNVYIPEVFLTLSYICYFRQILACEWICL